MQPLPIKSRLADRVREVIRTELIRGRWRDHLPSERSLSKQYEVSRPTLHLALRALEDEGFLRFRRGQSWKIRERRWPSRHGRRPEVALIRNAKVKPDITSFLPLLDIFRLQLHRLNLDLVVVDALIPGMKHLDSLLSEIEATHQARYYFLLSVPASVHRWFASHRMRAVILGSRTPDVRLPAIEFESTVAINHAIDYLIRRGHRQLGLLIHTLVAVGDTAVADIFMKTCMERADQGVKGVSQTCVARVLAVNSAVRKLLTRTVPPSAIIATDLELVMGLYTTAAELGIRIPHDLSVISLNYSPILDYLTPLPTCYQFSWERMAIRTVRLIRDFQRLKVWSNKFYQLLPTLREGDSVRKLSPVAFK